MIDKLMFKIIKIITKFLRKLNLDRIFFDKLFFNIGLNQISENRKNYKNIDNIQQIELKIFSQNGEDGIIDYLLIKLKLIPHSTNFIEIGVGDYRESNTRFIYNRFHSKGVIIDCIDDMKKKVKPHVNLWKGDLRICNSFINSNNINEILKKNCDFDVDVFSLDIDGIDYWIIQKLKKNISKIFIAEFNPVFGPKLKVTVPNIDDFDRTNYHYSNLCYGMSLPALVHIMKKKNFTFVGSNIACHNAFFISNNYISNISLKLPEENNLKEYVENNFRESRAKNYKLSFLSGEDKLKMISNCEVIDLSVSKDKSDLIKNIFKIN